MVKISIILPCYKVEKYLEDCLLSIQKQTYTNWECLIINDGSPENEREISAKWVEQDKRFVYYEKENGGVCDARNFGIERATGDYVYFLDPDDYFYDDESLEKFAKAVQEYRYDIVMARMELVPLNGGKYTDKKLGFSYDSKNKGDAAHFLFRYTYDGFVSVWSAGNKMYRLEFLNSHPQVRYEGENIGEDLVFNYKGYYQAESFKYIDEVTYSYVRREEGKISKDNSIDSIILRLEELIQYHNSQDFSYINFEKYDLFIRCFIMNSVIRHTVFHSVLTDTFAGYCKSCRLYSMVIAKSGKKIIRWIKFNIFVFISLTRALIEKYFKVRIITPPLLKNSFLRKIVH